MQPNGKKHSPAFISSTSSSCAGFTYIALLIAIALMGTVLAVTGSVWHTTQQREKERELLYIGNQFRQAIGQYYESSPGSDKHYPKKLEDLLQDSRFVTVKRHLRKIYADPMTGGTEWGLVKGPAGEITGVYSLHEGTPLKTGSFAKNDEMFAGKLHYRDWQFVYAPQGSAVAPASTGGLQQGTDQAQGKTTAPSTAVAGSLLKDKQSAPDQGQPVGQNQQQKASCDSAYQS